MEEPREPIVDEKPPEEEAREFIPWAVSPDDPFLVHVIPVHVDG